MSPPRRRNRPPNLRFAAPVAPPLPPGLPALHANVLAPFAARQSPLPYLAAFPPAQNAFASLLSLTPPHPRLLRAATHTPDPSPPSAKDAPAVHFVSAVAAVPPRVPVELRSALAAGAEKLQPVALLSSFAAFYETVCALLGLEDGSPEANASDVTESVSGRAMRHGMAASDAGADAMSIASSAASLPARLAASARAKVVSKVSFPLKKRLAARAVRRTQKTRWLAHVPLTKRSQDDFVRAAMGFAPEYLTHVRSSAHRAVFVYILDEILLRDSLHGISTAVKQLVCYVLARSSENSVLTAHAAFLANRFGADDRQLAACMDVAFLHAVHTLYASRESRVEKVTETSSSTSASSSISSPPQSPPPIDGDGVRRRRRSLNFGFPKFDDRDDAPNMNIARGSNSRLAKGSRGFADFAREDREAIFPHRMRNTDDMVPAPSDLPTATEVEVSDEVSGVHVNILPDNAGDGSPRNAIERVHSAGKMPDLSIDDSDSLDGSLSSGSEPCTTRDPSNPGDRRHDEFSVSADHSFYDLGDNPAVPEVTGLNSMDTGDFESFNEDLEGDYDYDFYGQFTPALERPMVEAEDEFNCFGDGCEHTVELDHSLFTEKEVAVLLLAHDVAQASRRNSRRCAKYADATPGPLVAPARVAVIEDLFEAEGIMEIISVMAGFHVLQRWTVCYPYRPGALEAPVRRFVQSQLGHDLCVGSVGQRSASKSSAILRTQGGRALRLPRHVLVSAV